MAAWHLQQRVQQQANPETFTPSQQPTAPVAASPAATTNNKGGDQHACGVSTRAGFEGGLVRDTNTTIRVPYAVFRVS
jgi:hypothetical protein